MKSWTDLALEEVDMVWPVVKEKDKGVIGVEGSGLKQVWRKGRERVLLELTKKRREEEGSNVNVVVRNKMRMRVVEVENIGDNFIL